jgi:molybdopterin synthase sulfur carrier subunit
MRVHVKLFATLVRYGPGVTAGIPFNLDLPDGATIADLVAQLVIPAEVVKVTFVNGRMQTPEYPLSQDDEVGIFPPIGGG